MKLHIGTVSSPNVQFCPNRDYREKLNHLDILSAELWLNKLSLATAGTKGKINISCRDTTGNSSNGREALGLVRAQNFCLKIDFFLNCGCACVCFTISFRDNCFVYQKKCISIATLLPGDMQSFNNEQWLNTSPCSIDEITLRSFPNL